jgi:site-specific DNA-cytosine methylase
MAPPLRSLDLFSGVGALTLSLKGVVEPAAYCEISPQAVAVLTHQMEHGALPLAPVCSDVRQLTPAWLKANVRGRINALIAGCRTAPKAWV